jgi:Fe2+ or Zn2+ uptake regulation protein
MSISHVTIPPIQEQIMEILKQAKQMSIDSGSDTFQGLSLYNIQKALESINVSNESIYKNLCLLVHNGTVTMHSIPNKHGTKQYYNI